MRFAAIALLPLALAAFAPQAPNNEAPQRMSIAEKLHLMSAATDAVVNQLLDKGCWTDHRDMPEARRLKAAFRIQIGPDGHFRREPELVHPVIEPANDAPLRTFIGYAREALSKCNAIGFDLPPNAFDVLRDNDMYLEFSPRIG